MATAKRIPDTISRILTPGGQKELRDRQARDLAERQAASTILNPGEVAGDYDARRMLMTTLGGQLRPLTVDDLRQLAANARRAGKRFKGGITAKDVIELSLREDRERASREIKVALPVRAKGDTILFVTNAGPDSDVQRHHVTVAFDGFGAAVASPSPVAKLARSVLAGPLKFDCDCGRHRYWFRYIATIGRFNAGRDEPGFPKIRNPNLRGVACKHVLRTMERISKADAGIALFVQRAIAQAREDLSRGRAVTASKADLREAAQRQIGATQRSTGRVLTAAEKAKRAAVRKATAAMKPDAKAARSVAAVERHARTLAGLGLITQGQLTAMLKAVSKAARASNS
jgi:hypothetical protein